MKYEINGKEYTDEELNAMDEIIVNGDLSLYGRGLIKFPKWVSKCVIYGYFNCSNNKLKNLKDGPKFVGGDYYCNSNELTSLEGCPDHIHGWIDCSSNKLKSLKSGPKTVDGSYYCYNNELISLKGCPKHIHENFDCSKNKLKILKCGPKFVGRDYYCRHNSIEIYDFIPEIKGNFYCDTEALLKTFPWYKPAKKNLLGYEMYKKIKNQSNSNALLNVLED